MALFDRRYLYKRYSYTSGAHPHGMAKQIKEAQPLMPGNQSPQRQKPEGKDSLESLGNLFVEPDWLFYREDSAQKVSPTGTLSWLTQITGFFIPP